MIILQQVIILAICICISQGTFNNFYENGKITKFLVQSEIQMRYATTKIELQIQNTLEDTSDDSFEMCIPENAIISNFSMTIKDKVYLAKVKTKEDAENIYGYGDRTSGLLQNYNFPDICMDDTRYIWFAVKLDAGEKASFQLHYEEFLSLELNNLFHYKLIVPPNELDLGDFSIFLSIKELVPLTKININGNNGDITRKANIYQQDNEALVQFTPEKDQEWTFDLSYGLQRNPDGNIVEIAGSKFIHSYRPESQARHIIFVIDVSGSMCGQKQEHVVDALMTTLDKIKKKQNDYINIILFNDAVQSWPEDSTYSLADHNGDVSEAIDFILSMPCERTTDINKALLDGLQVARKVKQSNEIPTNMDQVIVFLTDGEPTDGETNSNEISRNVNDKQFENLFFHRLTSIEPISQDLDCPPDWWLVGEQCYSFSKENKNYHAAEKECKLLGAKLFEPKDRRTNSKVFQIGNSVSQTWNSNANKWVFFWVGIHDAKNEGRFSYLSNNNTIQWSNWKPGEPSNNFDTKQEDCVYAYSDGSGIGKWNDANCDEKSEYICEKPALKAECQNIELIMKNDAHDAQGSKSGIYEIHQDVNGKKSWISSSNAIWYVPTYNSWAIGNLASIGSNSRVIASSSDTGDKSPYDVSNDDWYYDENGWNKANEDISIECVNDKGIKKVKIHGMAFGEDADWNLVQTISEANQGYAKKITDFGRSYLKIEDFINKILAGNIGQLEFKYKINGEDIEKNQLTRKGADPSEYVVIGEANDGNEIQTVEILIEDENDWIVNRIKVQSCQNTNNERCIPKKSFKSLREIMNNKNVMEKIWTNNRINWLLADDNSNCRSGKYTIDPKCEEEALKLALQYNFVTDLTSMIVEESDEYDISGILGKANPSSSTSTRTSLFSPELQASHFIPETTGRECIITLFSQTHSRGQMKTLTVSQNNLGDFDDQIASLKVEGDCNVTLFNDPDFKGKMMTFIPGVYETALQLRDVFKKASSIEINV